MLTAAALDDSGYTVSRYGDKDEGKAEKEHERYFAMHMSASKLRRPAAKEANRFILIEDTMTTGIGKPTRSKSVMISQVPMVMSCA